MEIEEFDGTVIELTDEGVERLLRNKFSPVDTCRFHLEKGGVACDASERREGDCDRCGWNPRVARNRSFKIREGRRPNVL